MEKLSRCHPISLPHSGELFVMCLFEEKAAKASVRIGWSREAREVGQVLRSIPGEGGGALKTSQSGRRAGRLVVAAASSEAVWAA